MEKPSEAMGSSWKTAAWSHPPWSSPHQHSAALAPCKRAGSFPAAAGPGCFQQSPPPPPERWEEKGGSAVQGSRARTGPAGPVEYQSIGKANPADVTSTGLAEAVGLRGTPAQPLLQGRIRPTNPTASPAQAETGAAVEISW